MKQESQLEVAIRIAGHAHRNQNDRLGRPYVTHCARIADTLRSDRLKTIAYLHDVIEKSESWSMKRLADAGIDGRVRSAVDALTRRPGEAEQSYLRRVCENDDALPVKVADLKDNLQQALQTGEASKKYQEGLAFLAMEISESSGEALD